MVYKNRSIQSKSLINPYPLWSGNIFKDFAVDNMKKRGLRDMYMIFLSAIILLMLAVLRYSQVFDEKIQCRINAWIHLGKVYCSVADVMLW